MIPSPRTSHDSLHVMESRQLAEFEAALTDLRTTLAHPALPADVRAELSAAWARLTVALEPYRVEDAA